MKALAARDPKSPLLEPAVRWLLLNRNYGGWWSSTKQTAMALYGLLDYMRARQEGGADAGVEVLVNGTPAGVAHLHTRVAHRRRSRCHHRPGSGRHEHRRGPQEGRRQRLLVGGCGVLRHGGRLERTGSRKLALVRKYFSLTPVRVQDRIVYRETPFDGTAQPGDLLLVRVDAAGSNDWRYLVIEDPLPAGTEPIQQLGLYELEKKTEFWDGSRREYRDDRVVFFQESFTAGHYQFVYLLKVTTPGVFRAMPAQIAAMYVPDATASSDPQTVTVGAVRREREGRPNDRTPSCDCRLAGSRPRGAAGLYWLLLAIPESNVAMLAASTLTMSVAVLLFGWVEAVGLLAWRAGRARARTARDAPSARRPACGLASPSSSWCGSSSPTRADSGTAAAERSTRG